MNYIGLTIEIKKMIGENKRKQTIINFINSKWESQPLGFSKRIDSIQNIIRGIRAIADTYKGKKFNQNVIMFLDGYKRVK